VPILAAMKIVLKKAAELERQQLGR